MCMLSNVNINMTIRTEFVYLFKFLVSQDNWLPSNSKCVRRATYTGTDPEINQGGGPDFKLRVLILTSGK